MTEEQIQQTLADHAKRIEQARRENWSLPPISLQEKESRLRWEAERPKLYGIDE